ncbi:MAG: hypothetical protein M0P93_05435 [Candidatus Cloacimonetes bacterium]|nr:hypothetical protein [Candidatus Cloacimonadota bacterium]
MKEDSLNFAGLAYLLDLDASASSKAKALKIEHVPCSADETPAIQQFYLMNSFHVNSISPPSRISISVKPHSARGFIP